MVLMAFTQEVFDLVRRGRVNIEWVMSTFPCAVTLHAPQHFHPGL